MKKVLYLLAFFVAFSSCVKSNIEGTDAVLEGFDWKTTRAVSISVSTPVVDASYQKYATTITVYTKPLYISKYLVSQGAAYTGKPYTATLDLPNGLDTLYISANVPGGSVHLYKYVIGSTKAAAYVKPSSSVFTKSGILLKTISVPATIPVPGSYNGTFTSTQQSDAANAVGGAGNWLLKGPISWSGFSMWGWSSSSVVYISGNVTLGGCSNIAKMSIVVLPGATLSLSDFAYASWNSLGQVMIEVKEGGTLNIDGGIQAQNAWQAVPLNIVNRGTVNFGSNASYNVLVGTSFYNLGTCNFATSAGYLNIEANAAFYNFGTLNAQAIECNGTGVLENEAGGVMSCTSLDLANATTYLNNNGSFVCSGTFNTSGGTINNSGYIAATTFAPDASTINCASGSLLSVDNFAGANGDTFNLDPNSIVVIDKFNTAGQLNACKFNNTSTTDYALVILGMQITGSDGTLTSDTSSSITGTTLSNTRFDGAVEVYYPNAANAAESESWTHTLCNDGAGKEGPAYFGHDAGGPSRINDIPTTSSNEGVGHIGGSAPTDTDGDGVPDDTDQFPTDPTLAYVSYFPSEGSYCTYAFEDLWSNIGDYDLNDLVIYCNIGYYKNASNMVVYEKVKWKLMAAGTSMLLSCGVQLDGVTPSEITSVTNTNTALASGPIGHSMSNGCESGQTYAVFPLLNSPAELFGVYTFVNTGYEGGNTVTPVEKETKITFSTPLDPARLGMDAFNLFICVSKNFDATYRGKEVHLMGNSATDLIDPNLLKYNPNDPTDWKSEDNPYRLRNGLVWALMIPTEFHWARERIDVASIYTNYINWYSTAASDAQYWYDTSVSANVSNYNWLYN